MKRVLFLIATLCLIGCSETPEEKSERVRQEQNKDATFRVNFRCVDGYLFVQKEGYREYSISQFWEIGPNGQPRPRVCGNRENFK